MILTGILVFVIALSFSFLIVWILLKSPLCALFCDPPGQRKVHQRIIPRIGGVGIVTSFIVLLALWRMFFTSYLPDIDPTLLNAVIFATLCIFIVGVIDDVHIFYINNRAKFFLEILIAFEIAYLYGIRYSSINVMGNGFDLGVLSIPISILWIVGTTNAANIIDGIDGLASGVLAVGFLAVAIMAANVGAFGIVILCLIIAGTILGFLIHNVAPAKAFLGDTGALFLGMILSILAIHVTTLQGSHSSIIVAILIAGFPILDVWAAMTRRFMKALFNGYSIVQAFGRMGLADNEHIHHRLLYRGLGHAQTSLILHLFSATFCAAAILISRIPVPVGIVVLLYLAFVAGAILYRLNFFDRITRIMDSRKSENPVNTIKTAIGIVNDDPLLHHALKSYEQTRFTFEFLSADNAMSVPGDYGVIVFVGSDPAHLQHDLQIANTIAKIQVCKVIFICDFINDANTLRETAAIPQLIYFKTPVYIPVLMENLYTLSQLKKVSGKTTSMKVIDKRTNPLASPVAKDPEDMSQEDKL